MRIGSLCSGYEGLSLAVHAVIGGELAWVADNDEGAAKILAYRFPSVPNLGDISRADWAAVEPVDVLCAGFPCQDVSYAGARKGLRAGTRTGVWSYVAEAIGALRPSLVLLENVRGLLSAGADSDMEPCPWCLGDSGDESALRALGAVLGDLADLGFDAEWTVISAAEAGAPHRRERVFVLAWPAGDADGSSRGQRRVTAPRQAEGRRPHPDAGGPSGAPAADAEAADGRRGGSSRPAQSCAQPGESERPQPEPDDSRVAAADADIPGRQGAEPARRHLMSAWGAPADANGPDAGQEPGGSGTPPHARTGDGTGRRGEPGSGIRGGAPADPQGDGRDEGRPEPAGLVRGPDAAVGGDGTPADANGSGRGPGKLGLPEGKRDTEGRTAADAERDELARESQEGRRSGAGTASAGDSEADRGGATPANAASPGREACGDLTERTGEGTRQGSAARAPSPASVQWGAYEPAIRRWEAVIGRPAPRPTEPGRTGERLSPRFVEFLMGLPEGWVTDVPGLSRNAQLKALGNGVVPQQAELALRLLLARAGFTGTEAAA